MSSNRIFIQHTSPDPRPRLQAAAVSVFFILSLGMAPAWGQSSRLWRGRLRDARNQPIAAARIRLAGASGQAAAVTDAQGQFHFSLPSGRYRLAIQAARHRIVSGRLITLARRRFAVRLRLPGGGHLLLTPVTQAAADQASGGERLSSHAVSNLPLNRRNLGSLLLLAAGTMTDVNGATNFTQQYSINGQRGVEATFSLDGADISDPEMGGATFPNFNVDAVQEVQSQSGWMPASVGRGAAGTTNIITRSGAAGFHGSIFEFLRNSALDARNFFDYSTPAFPRRIPPFRRNQFGFTNGGGLRIPGLLTGRRTFYFVEYQGFRQELSTTQILAVPTAAERAGIDPVTYPNGAQDTLYVPVNPRIAAILARYPLPNLPSGPFGARTYAASSPVETNSDQFSLRLDRRLASRGHLFARVSLDNLIGPVTNPDQTAIDPAFGVQYVDRQRNVALKYTRVFSPRLVTVTLLSVIRSTPGFPTTDHTDPGVVFNNGLFEAFNSAAGSVMQAYGNLFQFRQSVSYTKGSHSIQAGFEARLNRDSTYFGTSPNGEYNFGGGTAYATEAIPSASGRHNLAIGDPLPDTLSAFLSGSAFSYSVAVAPPNFSGGQHIGPAAISRNNISLWAQDTWHVNPRLTLDYGLRWDLYTPISERADRTGGFQVIHGVQQYVINPRPAYRTNWAALEPRLQISWRMAHRIVVHAGGSVMTVPPNIWQNNFLTGSTPFVVYPEAIAAPSAPLAYGFQITPAQLPAVYTPQGANIFASGGSKNVPPNTVMDVNRYEQAIAALTPNYVVSALSLSGIDPSFGNATLYTWVLGFERQFSGLTADLDYVGTAAQNLSRVGYPNAYSGASPGFAPYTLFNTAGNVTGGFGVENVIFGDVHSTYHSLQASLAGSIPHGGPGLQASFTWSKSLDDVSQVLGGTGSTGAVAISSPQDPFNLRAEKGPSNFDISRSFSLSFFQRLRLERIGFLSPLSRKLTRGWQLLSISSLDSGAPFTVYSGLQQTGYGSGGADRPDQIAQPVLSTGRTVRQDYFGQGANNAADYFSIPIHVAGGTGPNQGRFGTLGRNTFRGPALYDYDFALVKNTPVLRGVHGAERAVVQFRAEFFNLFNIVNMGLPANVITGSGFGQISQTANNSRQIQFSLKLIY